MFLQIITQVPLWVWPLALVLIYFGRYATKQRTTPAFVIYCMPLMGLLSINNLSILPNQTAVWGGFALFYVLGGAAGFELQQKWIIAKTGHKIEVAGEWVTGATIFTIFMASFFNGMLMSIAPDIMAMPAVYFSFVALKATISGIFVGRAIRVWQYMSRTNELADATRT